MSSQLYSNITTVRNAIDAFTHFLEDSSGRVSRNKVYPHKYVYYYLNMYTNKFSSDYNKILGGADPNIVLTIPCVSLEEIDQVECPCAPAKGCTFYKSEYPIPGMHNGMPLSITTVDGSVSYDYVEWFNIKSKLESRFKPDQTSPYYTFKNIGNIRHLYLYSSDKVLTPKLATVTASFFDPLEVAYYPVCGKVKQFCSPLEEPFIISKEIQSKVFEATLVALTNTKIVTPYSDILNNDSNETSAKG